jgi:hypothetical protein
MAHENYGTFESSDKMTAVGDLFNRYLNNFADHKGSFYS